MAITLASDALSDAEVTDGIGSGDLSAAARLWVRHWPTALAASRRYVERREVPGLAAEALIGTLSMTAMGRGPREAVADFVTGAVRELGEDDEQPPHDPADLPEVYASPRMSRSFAELPGSAQEVLRDVAHGAPTDEHALEALTVLQSSYLTTHLGDAPSRECRPTHISLLAAVEGRARNGFAGTHWLHMSTCAWCTEAFHEIAFSNLALDALIAPAVLAGPVVPALPPEVAEPLLAAVAEEELEQADADAEPFPAFLVAEAEEPEEPEDVLEDVLEDEDPQHAHRAGVHAVLRGSRNRVLVAAGFTAAVALIAVTLSQSLAGGDETTAPTAATSALPTPEPTATGGNDAFALGSIQETPSPEPTATVAGPLESPTAEASATPEAEETTAAPTPKPKPTRKPSPRPSASSSAPPAPDPTPAPTPTTRPCNPLQALLGFCPR